MRQKTTRVICNSEDIPVPLIFTPLALTPEVLRFLARYTEARRAREKAGPDSREAALRLEDTAALKLAWALERALGVD